MLLGHRTQLLIIFINAGIDPPDINQRTTMDMHAAPLDGSSEATSRLRCISFSDDPEDAGLTAASANDDADDGARRSSHEMTDRASQLSAVNYGRWSYLKEGLYDDERSSRISRCSRASNRDSFVTLVKDLKAGVKPEGAALRYSTRRAARKRMSKLERVVSVDLESLGDSPRSLVDGMSASCQPRMSPIAGSPARSSDGQWPASPATILNTLGGAVDSPGRVDAMLAGRGSPAARDDSVSDPSDQSTEDAPEPSLPCQ